MNWPNFFVVGAPKAGTTTLYTQLKRHPQVFLPHAKEPLYFTREVGAGVDFDGYRALYADAKGYPAIGDMSPLYLPQEGAAGRIREVCPAARIVIMLRDPVERAFSRYLQAQSASKDSAKSFLEAVTRYDNRSAKDWFRSRWYVEDGLYHAQVLRYLVNFGNDQVLVLLFDDLVNTPNDLLARIATHIGVDPGFYEGLDVSEVSNAYRMPRARFVRWVQLHGLTAPLPRSLVLAVRPIFFNAKRPRLDDASRRLLQKIYDPDITRLEELLGRKLPQLRKSWV